MRSRIVAMAVTLLVLGGVLLVGNAAQALPAQPSATMSPAWVGPPIPQLCFPNNDGWQSGPDENGVNWECVCRVVMSNPDSPLECKWRKVKTEVEPLLATWINLNSGKYLDLQGPDANNGEIVHQWTSTGASNQLWRRSAANDTYAELHSGYDNLCMGVIGASKNFGASIVQWGCNGSADQQWAFAWTGQMVDDQWPVFNIVNLNTHQCLGISGGSKDVGAPAVQWWCNGSADQGWY